MIIAVNLTKHIVHGFSFATIDMITVRKNSAEKPEFLNDFPVLLKPDRRSAESISIMFISLAH